MRIIKWLVFGLGLTVLAKTWNGDQVQHAGLKVCWYLHDLFMK